MKKKKFLTYLILVVLSAVSLFPFYMMLIMSTYYTEDIFKMLPLVPANYFIENIKIVFASNFLQAYGNSIFVSVTATCVCVLISAMAGYGINAYHFRAKKFVRKFVMVTMMVPTQIGIIGYMIEMKTLGFTNTLWPLIFFWFASGFGVFWMMQFIQGALPMEIVESARIDGCNELKTFFFIVVPCIVPAITTLMLLIFLWSWNSYMYPLVFVNRQEMNTIPLYIKGLSGLYRVDYGAQLAGLVLATVPLVLMFIIGSKSFIKGLTAGAVKG